MQAQLKRFCVVGLHDRRTIDVHIEDNKLILVGENGTGKSTFANLIYFFLTRQWRRLHEYRFEGRYTVFTVGNRFLRKFPWTWKKHTELVIVDRGVNASNR